MEDTAESDAAGLSDTEYRSAASWPLTDTEETARTSTLSTGPLADPPTPRGECDSRTVLRAHKGGTRDRLGLVVQTTVAPLLGSLGCASAFMLLPARTAAGAQFWVVELVHYLLWSSCCALGTVMYLDAVAPVTDNRLVLGAVAAGAVSCPGFWLVRLAVTGSWAYDHQNLAYNYVILVAIAVPLTIWLVAGSQLQQWQPPAALTVGLLPSPVRDPLAPDGPASQARDSDVGLIISSGRLQSPVKLYEPWIVQARIGCCVVIFWGGVYTTLATFMKLFEQQGELTMLGFGLWYAGFQVVCQAFKTAGKRLGVMADSGKVGTFSLYFAMEFLVTLFYYTFYRTLFDKILSYWIFALLQALHLSGEWLFYPFKATEIFWRRYKRMDEDSAGSVRRVLRLVVLAPGVETRQDLQHVVAMELALRAICSVFSALSMILIVLLTDHGPLYVKHQFMEVDLGNGGDVQFLVLVSIAVVMEGLNMFLMDRLFFAPRGVPVFTTASLKHFGLRRCAFNLFGVSTTLLINLIYPKLQLDSS